MSEKTEEPTPQRLRKAREEGDAGVSVQAASAIGFLVAVALVPAALAAVAERATSLVVAAIGRASDPSPTVGAPEVVVPMVLALTVPIVTAVAVTSAVLQFVQAGGAFATKKLGPKLDRLDLVQGFKNLVSPTRLFSVVRSLALGALVVLLAQKALFDGAKDLAHVAGRLGFVPLVAEAIGSGLAKRAALAFVAFGAVDLFVTRRQWMSRLRMSKDEISASTRRAKATLSSRPPASAHTTRCSLRRRWRT